MHVQAVAGVIFKLQNEAFLKKHPCSCADICKLCKLPITLTNGPYVISTRKCISITHVQIIENITEAVHNDNKQQTTYLIVIQLDISNSFEHMTEKFHRGSHADLTTRGNLIKPHPSSA